MHQLYHLSVTTSSVCIELLIFFLFPGYRVEAGQSSLWCMATIVIFFHCPLLLAFSVHLSSSSAFLRSIFCMCDLINSPSFIFRQSSHPSWDLLRFPQHPSFFASALFSDLSSFTLTMCPAHFIWHSTILPTIYIPVQQLQSIIT